MTAISVAAADPELYPREADVKERLARLPGHPRIILPADTAAWGRRIEANDFLVSARDHMLALAERYVEEAPIVRHMKGRRMLAASRTSLARTACLAAGFRLTGDTRYLDRAREELLASAAFSDWNPSHFLDTAEMTASLAIGYDWLYDELSGETRATIRTAIVEKGLGPSFEQGRHAWWITTHNNWNQVCHAGMTLGALAIADEEPELAAHTIARAIHRVPLAMAEYAPDGAYPEGPGYWVYGTTYNVLLISALESALGTDFGLARTNAFLETADYPPHMLGPSGKWFNYSDCSERAPACPPAAQHWFAARRGTPHVLWHAATGAKGDAAGLGRFAPFALAWSDGADAVPPSALSYRAAGATPVATHRTSWTDRDGVFVGIKAGAASVNHAHMDAGSFVIDAGGLRWAMDPGNQDYHSLESKGLSIFGKAQDATRWRIYRMGSSSHGTLTVDGEPHRVGGRAVILEHGESPARTTLVDLREVVGDVLKDCRRRVTLAPDGGVTVEDVITAARDCRVRWAMVTPAAITLRDPRTAELCQEGQVMHVTLDAGAAAWEVVGTDPPHPYDAPNPGTRILAFHAPLTAGDETRFRVLLKLK